MGEFEVAQGLMNQGHFQMALNKFLKLEKKHKQDNWIKLHIANCYIFIDDYQSAKKYLLTIIKTESKKAENLHFTSQLLLTISQFDHALTSAKKAVKLDKSDKKYLAHLIRVAYEARDIATAKKAIQSFKKLDSNSKWLINFEALIASGGGDFNLAEELYLKLLTSNSSDAMAASGLVKCRKFDNTDKQIASLLAQGIKNTAGEERSRLQLAQAKYLNDIQQYDEAWSVAKQAKSFFDKQNPFDKRLYQQFIDKLIAAYQPSTFKINNNQKQHVLIVGMPRSGTTLVEQVLTGYSQYYPAGELPAIDYALHANLGRAQYFENVTQLNAKQLNNIAQDYQHYFTKFANYSGSLIIDKVPSNYLHIGLFVQLFPDIKVLNFQRNKYDVIASMMFTEFGKMLNYTNSVENIDFVYQQYQRLMRHWKELFTDNILTVDYEKFITDHENEKLRVLQFLKLDGVESDFTLYENVVETPSVWQVRQGLYQNAINRWKNYSALVDYAKP